MTSTTVQQKLPRSSLLPRLPRQRAGGLTRHAAIYVRISDDTDGQGLGVGRQEADCRALCEQHGWTDVVIYCDNDRSAYQRRKPRPEYQRMLDDIKNQEVDVVVAWHPDRLHRQLRELVPFVDLVNDYGVQVQTVRAGVYDLGTPTGRMQAHVGGAMAAYESEHKSERIKRKMEENAAEGKHHGGSRPYGWKEDRVTVDPDESKFVKLATDKALSGISMRGVARELNELGAATATGRPWHAVTVRAMLLRPRNAGIRIQTVNGVTEEVGPGKWEPIVPLEDFRRLEMMLKNPSRVTTPGRSGKVHLLSVIARCAICDAPMIVGKGKRYKGVSKTIYRCKSRAHVSRDQETLDKFITKLVIARMGKSDIRDLMEESKRRTSEAKDLARKIKELEDLMRDAGAAHGAGKITLAQLIASNEATRPNLDKLRSQALSPDRARILGPLVGSPNPERVWKSFSPEQRRAVVDILLEIKVKSTHRGAGFNPADIYIKWRD